MPELRKPGRSWSLPGLGHNGHVCLTSANAWGKGEAREPGDRDPWQLPAQNHFLRPTVQMPRPHTQRFWGGTRPPMYFCLSPTGKQILSCLCQRKCNRYNLAVTIRVWKAYALWPSNFTSKNFLCRDMCLLCKMRRLWRQATAGTCITAKTRNNPHIQKRSEFLNCGPVLPWIHCIYLKRQRKCCVNWCGTISKTYCEVNKRKGQNGV